MPHFSFLEGTLHRPHPVIYSLKRGLLGGPTSFNRDLGRRGVGVLIFKTLNALFDRGAQCVLPRLRSPPGKHNCILSGQVHLSFKQIRHEIVIEGILRAVVPGPKKPFNLSSDHHLHREVHFVQRRKDQLAHLGTIIFGVKGTQTLLNRRYIAQVPISEYFQAHIRNLAADLFRIMCLEEAYGKSSRTSFSTENQLLAFGVKRRISSFVHEIPAALFLRRAHSSILARRCVRKRTLSLAARVLARNRCDPKAPSAYPFGNCARKNPNSTRTPIVIPIASRSRP